MWANELVNGRPWSGADEVFFTDFGDCCRLDLEWKDGGKAYVLHDEREDALTDLARWGRKLATEA